MDKDIKLKEYLFWEENRIQLFLIISHSVLTFLGLYMSFYVSAIINAFGVVLNAIFIYQKLPPKWVRKVMEE